VGINGQLNAQRFGQHQQVARLGIIRRDKLVSGAHRRCNPAQQEPLVPDRLAAGNLGAGFGTTILIMFGIDF